MIKGDEVQTLRAEGYVISADKRQRIKSDFAPRSIDELRFILNVEQTFNLFRDRDGVALVLAFMGYHTIPWNRVHKSAHKRTQRLLNYINRHFHRASGQGGTTLHPRRIPKVAALLAKRVIKKEAVAAEPRLLPLRGLLTRIFTVLLNAAYLGKPITETDILHILLETGLPEPAAQDLARKFAAPGLLEDLTGMLRINDDNLFLAHANDKPSDSEVVPTVQASLRVQRLLAELYPKMNDILASPPTFPEADVPKIAEPFPLLMVQNLLYCCIYRIRKTPVAARQLEDFISGETSNYESTVTAVNQAKQVLEKFIEVKYGYAKQNTTT